MEQHEPLGTKRKDWFDNNTKLFKVGREGTLENCSEKIAYEIAKLIDLPCAKYEFGKLIKDDGTQILGIISENFCWMKIEKRCLYISFRKVFLLLKLKTQKSLEFLFV